MNLKKKNILITGIPGIGKTTLIRRLSEELKDFHPVGFYTAPTPILMVDNAHLGRLNSRRNRCGGNNSP